jgi:cardiolipin synthase
MTSHNLYPTPYLLSFLNVAVSLLASGHVILSKRDTRAAIGWIGLIWFSPLVGTVHYWLLGINRISRKARSLRRAPPLPPQKISGTEQPTTQPRGGLTTEMAHLEGLDELVRRVTRRSLLPGNGVEPLVDGDLAYPSMVRAIDEATPAVRPHQAVDSGRDMGHGRVCTQSPPEFRVQCRVLWKGLGGFPRGPGEREDLPCEAD